MTDLRFQLTRDWPLWFLALAAIVAIAVSAGLYYRSRREVTRRYFLLLLCLRIAAIGVLVLFIFRPVLFFHHRRVARSLLSILIDCSGSMSVRDGEGMAPRLEQVKAAIGPRSRFIEKLEADFDLAFFQFSSDAGPLRIGHLAELAADGNATALGRAVTTASRLPAGRRADAVILISDGIDNSGKSPLQAILQQGVVVHCIGMGTARRQRHKDIAVVDVEHERYISVDTVAEITVHVRVGGYDDQARIILKEEGTEIAQKQIFLQPDDATHPPAGRAVSLVETINFTPSKTGQFSYEVAIDPREDERIADNNRYGFSMIVTSPKIKVLYIEGLPRPEYKFLNRILQQDPNVELLSLVQVRKGIFLRQGQIKGIDIQAFPDDLQTLRKFNVVILGDVDRTYFTTPQLQNLQTMVSEGGGFLMLGGKNSFGPGGWAESPMAEVLPVRLGGKGDPQENTRFRMTLTPEGISHPIFVGPLPFFGGGNAGPPVSTPELEGCNVVRGKKPAATVIAVNPSRKDSEGNNLIVAAVAQYGIGRSMAFTADSTHRWWQQLRGLGRDTPYVKFWGQTVRWLAGEEVRESEQGKGITAFADKLIYQPGDQVSLFARARGEDGLATGDAIIRAVVQPKDGRPIRLQLNYEPGTAGEYSAAFDPPAPGEYGVTVNGRLDNEDIGEATAGFRVGKPNLEFDELEADEDLLRRIAQATAGEYLALARIDDLAERLRSREHEKRVQGKIYLWNGPIMFGAFLLLMSTEWVLRKRRQMA